MTPRTFKLTIAYDGTDYCGWQVQPGKPTLQETLQRSIRSLTGETVHVIGSGRTDAGVHAIAQVASCRIASWRATAEQLARAMNTTLPASIVVHRCVQERDGFHAIRDATGKRYRYQIQIGGERCVWEHRFWHRVRFELDVALMQAAAAELLGRHDFSAFEASGAARKSSIRTVTACDVLPAPDGPLGQRRIAIEVQADGFLYNMVRNIVGNLIEVGRGKWPPQQIAMLLAVGDRSLGGPTAPPEGLFLKRVDYDAAAS